MNFALISLRFLLTVAVLSCNFQLKAFAQNTGNHAFLERLMSRRQATNAETSREFTEGGFEKTKMAGLNVAVWRPVSAGTALPLVIFSHGFHGKNTQSIFFCKGLSMNGFIVIAPDHRDAMGGPGASRPPVAFKDSSQWTDRTFLDRKKDIEALFNYLKKDPQWARRIDWNKVALAGHSLGGYTCLALAGAWPSWKIKGIKAVVAMSPYCEPFVEHGNLDLHVPVIYMGGTRDFGITPLLKRTGGAYDQTSSPCEFVEFAHAGHLAFSGMNKDQLQKSLITSYAVQFLGKYVLDDPKANPEVKAPNVVQLLFK